MLSSLENPTLAELLDKVPENLEMADKWILSKLNSVVAGSDEKSGVL